MAQKKTTVSIIGLGLLGGSLALALKKSGGVRLTGWSPSTGTRAKARRILRVAPDLADAIRGADTVVLGAPAGLVVPLLKRILPLVRPGALVMDMASVKLAVAREGRRIRGAVGHFVPCHPMAGKEKSGIRFADAGLYRGRKVFLTPYPSTPKPLLRRAMDLWRKAGAVPVIMKPKDHDRRVAVTSHLPHLLACAVTEAYGDALRRDRRILEAVGTGFLDVTRIAASSPAMWTDIVGMNAGELRANLSRMRRRILAMEKDLRPGRRAKWDRFFKKVRGIRERLG